VAAVHPRFVPVPYQDSAEAGRLILRDGTTANVRLAHPEDQELMTAFFRRLSTDSRQRRFFSAAEPATKLIDSFCDDSDPRKQLCLIVTRDSGNAPRIIASANYMAHDEGTAEIALAVDDAFQGKGIGSLLLERLAVLAVRNGFRRFWAITMPGNQQMLDVFYQSGFECREIHRGVIASRSKSDAGKSVLTCIMEGGKGPKAASSAVEPLPNLDYPESAARVLGKLARYAEWRARPEGMILDFDDIRPQEARTICQQALREQGDGWLSGEATRNLLSAFALPVPPGGICVTADEAAKLAAQIGFPVALKLTSRTIVHKTEFGGVRLNLDSEAAVRQAFLEIQQRVAQDNKLAEMEGVLIQPMISGGVEVMVGMTLDPLFGPLIGFGLGGIHVEILKDVCFRVTPITDRDAAEMVRGIKGYRLLEGYRGHPPADIPAIEDLLLRVARLVEEVPEIAELDLNPVITLPPGRGCQIVDARIRVA
jgi:acyl-CoA synthetase (NDP forming)